MNDGEHYTQRSKDKTMIIKYSYKTGQAVDTLFNVASARECPFKTFDGYSMSADEKKILLYADAEPVYRRSGQGTIRDRHSSRVLPDRKFWGIHSIVPYRNCRWSRRKVAPVRL